MVLKLDVGDYINKLAAKKEMLYTHNVTIPHYPTIAATIPSVHI